MDISTASRNSAVIAAALPAPAFAAPPVAGNSVTGNSKADDPLISRVAGESEAPTRTGAGDNGEVRAKSAPGNDYTKQELAQLQDLRARDREVRAHEMAHLAAAGRHARGGPSFSFEAGPDGRRYAVAGEVSIDTSDVAGDPAATLAKAQQVRRAALAPANPSPQDRQIAAQAAAMAAQASVEIAEQRYQSEQSAVSSANDNSGNHSYAAAGESAAQLIDLVA